MTAAVSPKAEVAATPAPPPPQAEHTKQVALLTRHVEYFKSVEDPVRAAAFAKELKGTADRVAFDEAAAALVSQFGLSHEVTATTITFNDAVNFVAKVLHECADGVKTSHYQRAHGAVVKANAELLERNAKALAADPKATQEVPHIDAERMSAPWDPAADIIEHLALKDPAHIAAVRALFTGKVA